MLITIMRKLMPAQANLMFVEHTRNLLSCRFSSNVVQLFYVRVWCRALWMLGSNRLSNPSIYLDKKGSFHSNETGLMSIKIVNTFLLSTCLRETPSHFSRRRRRWNGKCASQNIDITFRKTLVHRNCVDNFSASRLSAPVFVVSFDEQLRIFEWPRYFKVLRTNPVFNFIFFTCLAI